MILANSNDYLWLYITIPAVIVLLIVTVVIFLIKKSGKKQYLVKLDALLEEIEVSNKSQLDAYISRLKTIANKNDAYVEIYNQLSAQLERLETVEREKLITRQKGLKDRVVSEKIKKGLLDQIKSFENAVILYKKEIKRIKTDLENYFAEGDSLRVQLTELQNQYQQVKNDIVKYSNSLTLCKGRLEAYVSNLEVYFDMLDENILAARYKEANSKLEKIKSDLLNVYGSIETIAQYCNILEVVIPDQLVHLKDKNDELEQKGYVVINARVYETIENINNLLERTKAEFAVLNYSNFETVSNKISNKITEVHAKLDQEVMATQELDKKYAIVSEKNKICDKEFIKTKRQFYSMQEFYKLPEEIVGRFNKFQSNATLLSSLNTEYSGFIYTDAKRSASYLLEKVANMDSLADTVFDDVDYFNKYFMNLKSYVDSIYSSVKELLTSLSLTIGKLRSLKCKRMYYKYIEEATKHLNLLKKYNEILFNKPIDIASLEGFNELISSTNQLIDAIEVEISNHETVLKSIVFANPLRYQFKEVDTKLIEIEQLFKDGNYALAQEKLNYILNDYHQAAYASFKEC